ncbi:MAG TPA: 30S ribosomal protein S12 methylthiotransferase RimO [Candidatus Krumholzibacteria bacterium]|jgi:ribosomal protein S12 methylthiotransferase|nr:30S ribosomal protein S12 methylthiotransferase RimO [Candidatus Krumholzibacteria bacterium]
MKAYIVTLGCPKNLVDSEATASVLRRSGCDVTGDPAAADVLLVGACSFLDSSWRETVEETRKLSRYKRGAKKKRLVLMGCLPKHRAENLESDLPWVDHFLPTGAHARLKEMMDAWEHDTPVARMLALGDADRFAEFETRELLTATHTAYVKVAEGCNRKCTFCAIPLIRGRQVSRSADSIVREVDNLVARGVKEVTLLAQDIITYRDGSTRFSDLVNRIAATGVDWVRIFYLHPAGLEVRHIEPLFEHPSVCRYLEMPVQHSSSRILERMQRSYDRTHIEKLMAGIRNAFPDVVIRSEVIVGFPGETDAEFDELKGFLGEFAFDSLGVFPYSPEPGTRAPELDGQLHPELIRERATEVTELQEALSFAARSRFQGATLRVLIDRELDADESGAGHAGRFYGQAPDIDGEVFVTGDARPGEFAEVRVTETDVFDLSGEVIPVLGAKE